METTKTPRRVDPITLAMLGAISSIVGGTVALATYIERRLPERPPSKTFRRLARHLDTLSDELGYLRKDIDILEEIFHGAEYENENRTVSLKNGAYLTVRQFMRYERVADATLSRLRRINALTLKIERQAARLISHGVDLPVERTSRALDSLDRILRSRDLTVEQAWSLARSSTDDLVEVIRRLRQRSPDSQ